MCVVPVVQCKSEYLSGMFNRYCTISSFDRNIINIFLSKWILLSLSLSGSLESSLCSDSMICSVLYPYFLSFLRTGVKHSFLLSSDDFNVYCGCDSFSHVAKGSNFEVRCRLTQGFIICYLGHFEGVTNFSKPGLLICKI